jgi:hypothetical protein
MSWAFVFPTTAQHLLDATGDNSAGIQRRAFFR